MRGSIYLIDVMGQANASERSSIDTLQNLQIQASNGKSVPLAAVANFRYESEQPAVWRRGRLPTITAKASIDGNVQPATVVAKLAPALKPMIALFRSATRW